MAHSPFVAIVTAAGASARMYGVSWLRRDSDALSTPQLRSDAQHSESPHGASQGLPPPSRERPAIVPAEGSSPAARGPIPKPLLMLGGKSVLARTLESLTSFARCSAIVVTCPPLFRDECAAQSADERVHCILGGATRQESVARAVRWIDEEIGAPRDTLVVIHDAARCLASSHLFQRALEEAQHHGAVTTALPMVDSLIKVSPQRESLHSVDRAGVWAVQTPQVFRLELILRAHAGAAEGATDDASLVAPFHAVRVIEGERTNIKITHPEDLDFAARLLGSGTAPESDIR